MTAILRTLGRMLGALFGPAPRRADTPPTLFSVGPDNDAPETPDGCVPVSLRIPTGRPT